MSTTGNKDQKEVKKIDLTNLIIIKPAKSIRVTFSG